MHIHASAAHLAKTGGPNLKPRITVSLDHFLGPNRREKQKMADAGFSHGLSRGTVIGSLWREAPERLKCADRTGSTLLPAFQAKVSISPCPPVLAGLRRVGAALSRPAPVSPKWRMRGDCSPGPLY